MKNLVLLSGLLIGGFAGCSTLKPPTRAQLATGQQAARQQVAARPLTIHIHDAPTVISKNRPLVFVDGRKYNAAKLTRLNPDRIDSINIVNSYTGISLYGNKGRDGVIVITTKKKGQ